MGEETSHFSVKSRVTDSRVPKTAGWDRGMGTVRTPYQRATTFILKDFVRNIASEKRYLTRAVSWKGSACCNVSVIVHTHSTAFHFMWTATCSSRLAKMLKKGDGGGGGWTVRRGVREGLWEKRSGDGDKEGDWGVYKKGNMITPKQERVVDLVLI